MELQAAIGLLRRRWWVMAVGLVIGSIGGVFLTQSTPETYRASSRLFVSIPAAASVQEAVQGVQLSTQLLSSYAKVVTGDDTLRIIARSIDNKLTPGAIRGRISAEPVPQTLLIDVRAVDQDPQTAAVLANAAADALTTVIGDIEATSTKAIRASVITRAGIPGTPIAPNPKRDMTVGAMLGLGLGAAAAFIIDALDRTIRTATIASEVYGAPFLGAIPRQRRLSSHPLAAQNPSSTLGEAYRVLRTAIRFRDITNPMRSVLVTSAAAGDGKSTVAANLAIAMAQDGAKVILIDADLRRTRLNSMFDLPESAGLSDVLLGKAKLRDALVPWSRGLRILEIGAPGLNPSEALGSQAMVDLLNEAKTMCDIVLVDAPPVLPVTDPTVLAALVDATVVVCRWGRTTLQAADATRQTLENVGANVIGVVLNAEGGGRSATYYRHYSTKPAHTRRSSTGGTPRLEAANGQSKGSTPVPPAANG